MSHREIATSLQSGKHENRNESFMRGILYRSLVSEINVELETDCK